MLQKNKLRSPCFLPRHTCTF